MLLLLSFARLLHLLQSFNAYAKRTNNNRDETQQSGFLSVGLVVRNYWSDLIKLSKSKVYKQLKAKLF